MAWFEIPLDSDVDQEFDVTVEVGEENVDMTLHLRYNTEGDFWKMDISDGNTGDMLVSNVPLLTGYSFSADMLRQFGYVGIGSAMVVKMTDTADGDFPNIDNLGTDYVLVWGKEDEG